MKKDNDSVTPFPGYASRLSWALGFFPWKASAFAVTPEPRISARRILGRIGMLGSLCCAVLLSAFGGVSYAQDPESDTVNVEEPSELLVQRGTLRPRMILTGELDTREAVYLNVPNVDLWPVSIRWIIEDGESVDEGDIVVEFDNSQLLSTYEDLEIAAYDAETQLQDEAARLAGEMAKAGFEHERLKATAEKARIDASVPENLRSPREHQMAQLALQKATLQLEQQEAVLKSLQESSESSLGIKRIDFEKAVAAAKRAADSINQLTIRAERSGIVIVSENWREDRTFKPGDNAFPGMEIARLPDLSTLYVRARLFDVDDGRLEAGQVVQARLDAFPEKVYRGVIREVAEAADQRSGRSQRRYFNVVVELDETDPEQMLPGMSVQILVEEEMADVLLVPRSAVDWPETVGGETRVRLANGQLATVTLSECDAFACIVAEGVVEGTRLAPSEG